MGEVSLPEAVLAGARGDGPAYPEMSTAVAVTVARAPRPERPVAVLCTHGPATVLAMLGILRAGRAYLVLDPRTPEAFHVDVLARHPVGAVVADATHADAAARLGGTDPIVLDGLPSDVDGSTLPSIDPHSAASVSLTSGSSGRPKAVVHSHRSLVHNARSYGEAIGVTGDDVVLVTGPFSAAAAGTPTWTALVHGARLVSMDLARQGAAALHDVLAEQGVTVAHIPPAALATMAIVGERTHPGVRLVSLGGDRLTTEQLRHARRTFPQATLLHRYSTSETHWVAGRRFDPDDEIPDGPLDLPEVVPWVHVEIESAPGSPAAVGEPGEVVVAGEWLALGYLDDPVRTAERFVETRHGRAYRTGDLARRTVDGGLVLLGRADDVVKVSGSLADPATVEEALLRMPGVTDAAVVAVTTARDATGLVAFVVGDDLRGWQVRAQLAEAVPGALVPGRIDVVAALPVNERGKVDRAALRERASRDGRPPYSRPQGLNEQRIASAAEEVLAVPDIGRDDDLLALGADSLAVTEIVARIEASLGRPVDEGLLLRHPTPAGLATRLAGANPASQSRLVTVVDGPSDAVPLALFSGGGGGHVSGMADLARAIGGRDSWVVVPRGFDEQARPDRTIGDMARTAAGELEPVLGGGPIVLIGHSIGGTVALQTARELASRGVAVPLVILLDTLAVTDEVNRGRGLWADLPGAIAHATQVRAAQGRRSSLARKAYWAARMPMRRLRRQWLAATAGVVPRTGRNQHAAFEALVKVASRRFTETEYNGEVLLVRAVGGQDPRVHRPDLGWGGVPGVRVTVVEVAATHELMIAGSAGLRTARAIHAALDALRSS